jgi:N-acetylglutamate synthase-like GNAT family acetyltransferase
MKLPGGTAWLDQLSVLDRWQGRGLGAALIDRTAERARELGYDTLYLSTYLGVPWNAPFYERRGFSSVPRGAWSAQSRSATPWEGAAHGADIHLAPAAIAGAGPRDCSLQDARFLPAMS